MTQLEKEHRIDQIDQTKADTFAMSMVDLLNQGATALMVSLGHRTGLFDVLADLPSATSAAIA